MPVVSIIISIVCALLIGSFLYLFLMRAFLFWSAGRFANRRNYIRVGIAAVSLCLAACCLNLFNITALILLHIVVFALAVELINLPIRAFSHKTKRTPEAWNKIYKCGLVPILITALLISYGYWNIRNVKETYYTVYTEKTLPAGGYRILLIADLHYGNAVHLEELQEYCSRMSEEDADLVVLCGDLVDESTTRAELKEAFQQLGSIKSKYGVFYVFGNHDQSNYRNNSDYTEEDLRSVLQENDITVLEDTAYEIDSNLTLIGRKDRSELREAADALTAGLDQEKFLLMLDHQPQEYAEAEAAGIDLLLSGHTHAGQIWPAGLLIEPLGFADSCYGYTQSGSLQTIVTSGISAWGYPVRTEGRSEFAVIDLLEQP